MTDASRHAIGNLIKPLPISVVGQNRIVGALCNIVREAEHLKDAEYSTRIEELIYRHSVEANLKRPELAVVQRNP